MPIKDCPAYEIGNFGTVRSLKRGIVILRPKVNRDGYLEVSLYHNSKGNSKTVHRLVALHWVDNPNPELYNEVNHLDGDKTNCAFWNLAWTDHAGNMQHANETGLFINKRGHKGMQGESHPFSRLTIADIEKIKSLKGIISQKELGVSFNVSQPQISNIQKGKRWKNVEHQKSL